MSEYQYYEFQAIDRPLTEREMGELRSFSSRATITPTRFVNHYEWGSFKGNPSAWMEKYFDAFLYLANWGTHELMLRLPRRVLDLATAKQYCCGESASARAKSEQVTLEFRSESESGEWVDEDTDHLASLIPLRADIASGDLRALYLAWLTCVQSRELDEADEEPPCPSGLGRLSAPLEAFIEFMRIDRDLLGYAYNTLAIVSVAKWRVVLLEAAHFALAPFLGFLGSFVRLFIQAPSGRQPFNGLGALKAITHPVFTLTNPTSITSVQVCELLTQSAALGLRIPLTSSVLDTARYQRGRRVLEHAASLSIELLFLPPYSPHLNLIERLWKFVKKHCLRRFSQH
jgi:DDE superfamily endonuclease